VTDTDDLSLASEDVDTSAIDPRHLRRIEVMQLVFSYAFRLDDQQQKDFLVAHPDMVELIENVPAIDQQIQSLAAERPLSDINKVDLAILRSIVFEWNTKKTPKKVLIDEAVELAKEFGTESSPKFVNGVLAHLFN
jgi:transcription antitermination protein NusB